MGEFPSRMSEFDSAGELVLLCKNGARSAHAVTMLQEAGFARLANVEGGILAWSDDVDPTVPKY
jgi:adenylyltransferase/sulfurtransferase